MTDAELNAALADTQGYVYAGTFHGEARYHPPGERNRSVPCPAYTTDWNALMPLVLHVWGRIPQATHAVLYGTPLYQRGLCEHLVATLAGEGIPTTKERHDGAGV